ncbi:MAG: hypothetical protein Q8L90_07075 [Bacteroidota bacterium]|nr:hypothetical protein [Bacteroidota bacterium]
MIDKIKDSFTDKLWELLESNDANIGLGMDKRLARLSINQCSIMVTFLDGKPNMKTIETIQYEIGNCIADIEGLDGAAILFSDGDEMFKSDGVANCNESSFKLELMMNISECCPFGNLFWFNPDVFDFVKLTNYLKEISFKESVIIKMDETIIDLTSDAFIEKWGEITLEVKSYFGLS